MTRDGKRAEREANLARHVDAIGKVTEALRALPSDEARRRVLRSAAILLGFGDLADNWSAVPGARR